MAKYCAENEKAKRGYAFWLETASGKQASTVDRVLRSIERFETSTRHKPFSKFHVEQARAFRASLTEETGPKGKPLSAATMATTLKDLREFFHYLAREPGYRSKIKANDAEYFMPSAQDLRIAATKREHPVPTVEEVKYVLGNMPHATAIEKRNRALIACALLTGARDGALATLRLKHVNLESESIFQDGREINTKRRKTFTTTFFPVGPEPLEIFMDYIQFLRVELAFGPDDPLFPATQVSVGADRSFAAYGLSKNCWSGTEPVRRVFRAAFATANLPYSNPHSIRKTLVRLGEQICRNPEEWKCWSQNLGHDSEITTFVGYGHVPPHKQSKIIKALKQAEIESAQNDVKLTTLASLLKLIDQSLREEANKQMN